MKTKWVEVEITSFFRGIFSKILMHLVTTVANKKETGIKHKSQSGGKLAPQLQKRSHNNAPTLPERSNRSCCLGCHSRPPTGPFKNNTSVNRNEGCEKEKREFDGFAFWFKPLLIL